MKPFKVREERDVFAYEWEALPDWAHGLPFWKLHVVLDQIELEAGWFQTALVEGSAKVWRMLERV